MLAAKAEWFRPGYAAAAACVSLAAWNASNAPAFREVINRTAQDTQLPLERLAVESDSAAMLSPHSHSLTAAPLSLRSMTASMHRTRPPKHGGSASLFRNGACIE